LSEPQEKAFQLSDATKRRLEDAAVAAFHNLMLSLADTLGKQMAESVNIVGILQQQAAMKIVSDIHTQPQKGPAKRVNKNNRRKSTGGSKKRAQAG
jgi:hypothetical protein